MATIRDVAKKSGYSVATVSAVINGLPVVSPEAREKILQAIEELGYRPNAIARSLKKTKTFSIGIIVWDITNPFYPEVVSGIEDKALTENYEVFLCNTKNNLERERKYVDKLIEKRVDGVIISTPSLKREGYYNKLRKLDIPYVFVNRKPEDLLDDEYFVGVDNRYAAEMVVDYLAGLGYRKIAFFAGPQQFSTFKDRKEGFLKGMEKNGLPVEDKWMFFGDFTEKNGYESTKSLIEKRMLPEAIFCSSDLFAFGAYLSLKEKGIRVPEDIALVGFDNNKFGYLIELTSVDLQNYRMGYLAGEILVNLLQKREASVEQKQILLKPSLVIRRSCGGQKKSQDDDLSKRGVNRQ